MTFSKAYLRNEDGFLSLGNDFFAIGIDTESGLGPCELLSKPSGFAYADSPYRYCLKNRAQTPSFLEFGRGKDDRGVWLETAWDLAGAKVLQRFSVPHGGPYFDERLTVLNTGQEPLDGSQMSFGFVRRIGSSGQVERELESDSVVAVPFRRPLQGRTGEYRDYGLHELFINRGSYHLPWGEVHTTDELASEGWIWCHSPESLLIAKHSPDKIEYSVISADSSGDGDKITFGGARMVHGDPDEFESVDPGSSATYSSTRYILARGGWQAGYRAFRDYMDSMGHGTPSGFDPPVHWNELYDNPLWWQGDDYRKRRELYTLDHMREEASKARELGCEALYLDPGWDTSFGSSIWPPYRLRSAEEFVTLMSEEFGLEVSLHMPLAVWCDPTAYSLDAHRRNRDGEMMDSLCGASDAYLETKRKRLLELARAGFAYFMFDGSAFTGECWDSEHGHSVPLKRSEHCRSIASLVEAVHEKYPDMIIELHDPILGGVPERYPPMHYLHGSGDSFDEGWAFEYMWDPMEDLISGRAVSLYYYNLAYSLPLYIHIDLRKDNRNALEFWWYASTCRHLGVGGKHMDPEVWNAHREAMSRYIELKRFYTQGIFVGLSEEAHLHYIPGESRAVLNTFNLDNRATFKEAVIDLKDIGFAGVESVSEGEWTVEGGDLMLRIEMAPRDARAVEIVFRTG